MDIRDYLRILRRHWILVVAATLVGLVFGAAASLLQKPSYTAETQLFVATQGSGTINELQAGNSFGQARVQSYVKTVTTPTVLQPVIDSLGLSQSAADLGTKVKATTDLNTVLITISVTDGSPVQASALAQGIATSLVRAVEVLEKPTSGGPSPIKLSIVTPAIAPTHPSAPNVALYLVLGIAVGIAAGTFSAMLVSSLDNRVRGEEDLRRVTQKAILGGIPYDPDAESEPLIRSGTDRGLRAESFKQLRTNLQFVHVSHQSNTLLVTSSLPGEGKTTTSINLALSMAASGKSVALVDADLRRPMVSEYLGLERDAGLTTALVGDADINDLLQPWGSNELYVLTSGQIPPNPSELLGSAAMRDLIERLASAFDTVIIDAPPLLPVTDATVLAQFVGGVAVVVGSSRVRQAQLERSLQSLELVDADILGVVLNRVPAKGSEAYGYGYYTYDSRENPMKETRRNSTMKGSRSVAKKNKSRNKIAENAEESTETFHNELAGSGNRPASRFPAR